jgi:hypothetical protein
MYLEGCRDNEHGYYISLKIKGIVRWTDADGYTKTVVTSELHLIFSMKESGLMKNAYFFLEKAEGKCICMPKCI